jgi:hypothetical protein
MSHQTTDHLLALEAMSLLQTVKVLTKQDLHGTLSKRSTTLRRLSLLRSLGQKRK